MNGDQQHVHDWINLPDVNHQNQIATRFHLVKHAIVHVNLDQALCCFIYKGC